jgi:hypothetical protein
MHDVVSGICNAVIMSQSCDLIAQLDKSGKSRPARAEDVIFCRVDRLEDIFADKGQREQCRRGNLPGYHLLNEFHGEPAMPFSVVDFYHVHTLSLPFVRGLAARQGPRLRLLPPYREHLSQAFARFFMRVGLPADIPRFA